MYVEVDYVYVVDGTEYADSFGYNITFAYIYSDTWLLVYADTGAGNWR